MYPVYTRDLSSGRVHIRIQQGKRLLVDERCNLDSAGAYEVVPETSLVDVDDEAFCHWCFPDEPEKES